MRRMLMVLAVLMAVSLVYCTDATGPGVPSPDTWRLDVTTDALTATAGADVAGTVEARLYATETARAPLIGATPLMAQTAGQGIAGEEVCWDVADPDIIRVRPICTTTDSTGAIIGEVVVGTEAADSLYVVAFATRDGAVAAVDTAWATVEAAAPTVLEFSTDSATTFIGARYALRDHVETLEDQYGNPIGPSGMSAFARAPWNLAAPDTVWADVEGRGYVGATGGTAADSILAWAIADLRGQTWAADLTCYGGRALIDGSQTDVDSTIVTFTSDSVAYLPERDTLNYRGAHLYGDRVMTYHHGADSTVVVRSGVPVWQGPQELRWQPDWPDGLAATDNPPTEYIESVAGSRCPATVIGSDSGTVAIIQRLP